MGRTPLCDIDHGHYLCFFVLVPGKWKSCIVMSEFSNLFFAFGPVTGTGYGNQCDPGVGTDALL